MALTKFNKDIGRLLKGENNHRHTVLGAVEENGLLSRISFQRWLIAVSLSLVIALFFQFPGAGKLLSTNYKLGDIAPEDFFAPRDILVVDETATDSKRQLAAENTWPVYDYDTTLAGKIEQKVKTAFAEVRQFYQREWDWNDAERRRLRDFDAARSVH